MATRLAHVAILWSGLTLILAVLLISTSWYKAPSASPRYPYPVGLHFRQSANPGQVVGRRLEHRTVSIDADLKSRETQEMETNVIPSTTTERPNQWPNLVGLDAEEAKKKILEENPNLTVHIIPASSFVTMDHRINRVRIFQDDNKKVSKPPRIG